MYLSHLSSLCFEKGRLLSPPPPDHRYAPNDYGSDRERYDRNRYSPEDSRYGDYPTDMYETEADYSPPRSPQPYRRDRNYRNYSPSPPPPPSNGGRKKSTASKGSGSSVISSDEWDRRTF